MTMEYEQWKEILSAIDKDKYLRGGNVINEIKKKLEEKDRDEYKKWEESGFSVNHKFTDFDETLLYLAVKNDCLVLVNALLGIEGINVNAKNEYCGTPLHVAALYNSKKAIGALLEAENINVNAKNKDCETPLHLAAKKGRKEAIDILMAKGADPLLKNKDGKTPMDLDKSGYIKQFLEKKAIKNGIIAGCATAALSTAIAVTLFATGTVAVELMSMMIAAAIVTAAALAVGGITYSILKPSTKMDETKEAQSVNGNVPEGGKAAT